MMNWFNNNNNSWMGNASNNMAFRPTGSMYNNYNLPHYDSPALHGRADANAFLIGPNSSIFLPDAEEDIIWWIKTDMQGNRTVMPFDIGPHKDAPPVDLNSLEQRLANVEEWIHAKSNKSNAKRTTATAATVAAPIETE